MGAKSDLYNNEIVGSWLIPLNTNQELSVYLSQLAESTGLKEDFNTH